MNLTIERYHQQLPEAAGEICKTLYSIISTALPEAESKIWHGHPVWFLDANPVVGYNLRKRGVVLLFWSGQSFEEPLLKASGSFKAAEYMLASMTNMPTGELKRWLSKARDIQWDYKNIVKRKGELLRLK